MTTAIITGIATAAFVAIMFTCGRNLNRRYNAETEKLSQQSADLNAYHAETMRIAARRRAHVIATLDCDDCCRRTCPHNKRGYDFNPNGFDPSDPPEFDPRIEIEAGSVYCQDYEGC